MMEMESKKYNLKLKGFPVNVEHNQCFANFCDLLASLHSLFGAQCCPQTHQSPLNGADP